MESRNINWDTIKFVREMVVENGVRFPLVKIYVNNRDLIDILREYELPFARKEGQLWLAGSYGNLPVPLNPFVYFLGKSEAWFGKTDDKTAILDCPMCGCPGCWTLYVKITVGKHEVIWSDFEHSSRNEETSFFPWDYSKLGPFRFDKERYYSAVSCLI